MQAQSSTLSQSPKYWPSARQFTEAIQCPSVCFSDGRLKSTLPAVDRLGMPLVTSGQFAFVYKIKSIHGNEDFAVRCFRGYLGDRNERYTVIQRHLKSYPVSYLSEFTYAPRGILVSGHKYPILFMKWIDGPTLDLYIDEMLHRKEVLFHLSQEWLKLVSSLRDAGIAHGDLQHGNIIVEGGSLRLVDHDGLFVPEMVHWTSSEVGHQHYQHPLRNANDFDSNLDNFSALVIYLTLIALIERPQLWRDYHDENLLFTKSDFINPGASKLFAEINEIGPEHQQLANALATAASGKLAAVPYLLDLTSIKSRLPSWMHTVELESHAKTREVKLSQDVTRAHPRWLPKQTTTGSAVPSTPSSSQVQTIFSAPATPAPPAGLANINDPTAVWRNTPKFAKHMLINTFIWWYWGLYIFLKICGLDFLVAVTLAVLTVLAFCLSWGFVKAQQVARAASRTQLHPGSGPSPSIVAAPSLLKPVLVRAPSSITADEPIVGNTALNIYHHPECEWVKKIPNKNRVSFVSPSIATTAGYKPCRVCSPKH